jgi:hypothetical protein
VLHADGQPLDKAGPEFDDKLELEKPVERLKAKDLDDPPNPDHIVNASESISGLAGIAGRRCCTKVVKLRTLLLSSTFDSALLIIFD